MNIKELENKIRLMSSTNIIIVTWNWDSLTPCFASNGKEIIFEGKAGDFPYGKIVMEDLYLPYSPDAYGYLDIYEVNDKEEL